VEQQLAQEKASASEGARQFDDRSRELEEKCALMEAEVQRLTSANEVDQGKNLQLSDALDQVQQLKADLDETRAKFEKSQQELESAQHTIEHDESVIEEWQSKFSLSPCCMEEVRTNRVLTFAIF